MADEFDIFESGLVPKQEILSEEEKAEFLKKHNISIRQLPRMKSDDAIVKAIGGKRGDVVKVSRESPVAGEYYYYRVII